MAPPPVCQALLWSFQVSRARLARRRNHVFAPNQLAGCAIKCHHEIADPVVATSRPEHDLVLYGERRGGEL